MGLVIGDKLVIASHNPGKVREIGDLIRPLGIEAISAGDLGLDEPEETGTTFIANAILKSEAAAKAANLPALADDSGLAVTALDGAPGIYSARWAGPEKDFGHAMQLVEDALRDLPVRGDVDRSAHFVCALALTLPGGETHTFEGRVDGTLVWPPRGDQGFGYDPIFQADGESITFGEMDPARKHGMSHRADAFQKFLTALGS